MVHSNETEIKILFSFSIKRILIITLTNIAGFIRDIIVQTVYQCQTKRSKILFIRPNGLAVRSNNLFICSNRVLIRSKDISIRSNGLLICSKKISISSIGWSNHSLTVRYLCVFPFKQFSVSVRLPFWNKGGAVVRALTSKQWGPGSNPGANALCGLSLLLVLSPAQFSPLLKSQHFQILIGCGMYGYISTSSHELLSGPWVNKWQITVQGH